MTTLKTIITKVIGDSSANEARIIGPDQYPLSPSDPYKEEHALINEYLEYNLRKNNWTPSSFLDCEAGKAIKELCLKKIKTIILAMIDRFSLPQDSVNQLHCCTLLLYALFILLKRKIAFTESELLKLIQFLPSHIDARAYSFPYEGVIHAVEEHTSKNELLLYLFSILHSLFSVVSARFRGFNIAAQEFIPGGKFLTHLLSRLLNKPSKKHIALSAQGTLTGVTQHAYLITLRVD